MQRALIKRKMMGTFYISLLAGLGLNTIAFASDSKVTVNDPGLKPYVIVDGNSIPASFTENPGNPETGKKIFVMRKKGNCLTCHTAPIPEEEFHGKVAPGLDGVADRLSAGEIRLRIVNPKVVNPDTPMMAFYKTSGLNNVKKSYINKPMLSEQEVEDVVAYLMTLKGSN